MGVSTQTEMNCIKNKKNTNEKKNDYRGTNNQALNVNPVRVSVEKETSNIATERKESNTEKYIKMFSNIEKYDLNQQLDEKFLKSLIRNRDVEYESFIKLGGTTSRPYDFVVFDLETTGLKADSHEIIEIGAIKFINGIPDSVFHTYVKPKKKISKRITDINGITNEMVEDSPTIEEVLPQFINFIEDYVLIAHNSDFDTSFILDKLYNMNFKKIKNKCIDTLKLSRQKIREYDFQMERSEKLPTYKLSYLKELLGLDELPSHNALDDCKVCAYLYLKIIEACGDFVYL